MEAVEKDAKGGCEKGAHSLAEEIRKQILEMPAKLKVVTPKSDVILVNVYVDTLVCVRCVRESC